MPPPTLRTARLTLRPFTPADAPAVQELASVYEIALNTLSVPHPYPPGAAETWIATHADDFTENRVHQFAVDDGQVVGSMGLMIKDESMAEIGYWIGKPFWGRGYACEAAEGVLQYGFEQLGMRRIFAGYFSRNSSSGNVLKKLGMRYEGTLRRHQLKWGEPMDVVFYGILRDEWLSRP